MSRGYTSEREIDELYRQLNAIDSRRANALTEMREANLSGDDDAWDAAGATHDKYSDERADIKAQIDELEERNAWAYERQVRADYYASVL